MSGGIIGIVVIVIIVIVILLIVGAISLNGKSCNSCPLKMKKLVIRRNKVKKHSCDDSDSDLETYNSDCAKDSDDESSSSSSSDSSSSSSNYGRKRH